MLCYVTLRSLDYVMLCYVSKWHHMALYIKHPSHTLVHPSIHTPSIHPNLTHFIHPHKQHNEFGGYFIVNGIERCVRLLQIPRRNHPTAIQRSNYKNRGPTYTDLGIAMRCARANEDQTSITNTVHYLTTGGASLKFTARKQEFLIPVILILRALSGGDGSSSSGIGGIGGVTDEELYNRILQGDEENTFLKARAELLLQDAQRFTGLNTPNECIAYIGSRFRMLSMKADSTPDVEIGHYIIDRFVLIHCNKYGDKLECLLLLLRKLYSFAAGDCGIDNADSLQNQEILMPGHLVCSFVKEKFEEMFMAVRIGILKEMRMDYAKATANMQDTSCMSKFVDRYGMLGNGGIGKKVQHFLSTGNIISSSGLDLMQVSGYTIVAERLNFLRYCAHFRSVHRGQFFLEMKTTAVRKLLPDQWGFLCPVHTPDGGPCGLLSHLALKSIPMTAPAPLSGGALLNLDDLLVKLGVSPSGAGGVSGDGKGASVHNYIPVCIDGRVVGGASSKRCKSITSQLRQMKVQDDPSVPPTLEIALIPPGMYFICMRMPCGNGFQDFGAFLTFFCFRLFFSNVRRYQGRTISRTFFVHRKCASRASSIEQKHRKDRNDWTHGTTFHGYCLSRGGRPRGYYNTSRARSYEHAQSHCESYTIFRLQPKSP